MDDIKELVKGVPCSKLVNINGNFAIEFPHQTIKLSAVFDQDDLELVQMYEIMAQAPLALDRALAELQETKKNNALLAQSIIGVLEFCLKKVIDEAKEDDAWVVKQETDKPPTVGEK